MSERRSGNQRGGRGRSGGGRGGEDVGRGRSGGSRGGEDVGRGRSGGGRGGEDVGRGRSGGGRGSTSAEPQSFSLSRGRGTSGVGRGSGGSAAPSPSPSPSSGAPSPSSGAPSPSPSSGAPSSSSRAPSTSASSSSLLVRDVEQKVSLQEAPPSSSKAMRFPARPGFGKIGDRCLVRANHFLVNLADKDLHHYDVSISPEITSKAVNRNVIRQLVDMYRESHLGQRKPVYDGSKSLYTAGPLPFTSKEFVITLVDRDEKTAGPRRERAFKVSIKLVGQADIHHLRQFLIGRQMDAPQETLQVLDVALRESPTHNYVPALRSFFSPQLGPRSPIGDGIECWKGFYQSIRPTQMGLSLNVDISATSFYEPILVTEFVTKFLNKDPTRPFSNHDCIKVKKALRGIKIQVIHRGDLARRYRVSGITSQPTNQLTFLDEQGTKMSVVQYFRDKYKYPLQYVTWPSLQVGSDSKPTYLPMEVCKIVEGQRYTKKLNERQVTAILREACKRPQQREQSILEMVSRNNYNGDEFAKEFGIQVKDNLATFEARVLPPPVLKYHDTGREARCLPRVGQWNMINKKMVNGGTVDCWTCLNFSRVNQAGINQFCWDLVSMCGVIGMNFSRDPLVPFCSVRADNIERALKEVHNQCTAQLVKSGIKGKQLQLLIVVLPEISGSYGRIKRICETELGIVSQCCLPKNVSKNNKQYLENVALKINVKAGGRNTVLADALTNRLPLVTDAPTIIFGADVTHPPPGEDFSPSIAAVVASMDWPEVTKYRGLVSAQRHRNELIEDLFKTVQDPQRGPINGGMIRELLIAFWKSTNRKPHRILFYRDGVSEGQFSQVLLHELDAIRKACASLEEGYLPPVTFVVVQKRHHTRLFPADHRNRNLTDRSGNILPGTVVDTNICHPTEFDFYLCSHAGIQGTSRPTHYHVLWDENRFTADGLQTLTNNLCYTYARCTRSVSIVPPAYYAHLAAFRARYYIEGDSSDGGSTLHGGSSTREGNIEARVLPQIKENVKEVMFYC